MKKLLLLLAGLSCAIGASAQSSKILYGPWVHNVSETGFTLMWVGESPSLDYVEVAPDDGTAFESCERARYYESSFGKRLTEPFHHVRIEGLQPGTRYRYRITGKVVKDDSNAYRTTYGPEHQIFGKVGKGRPAYVIRTLDAAADTCRFSMVNDIHFDDARFKALTDPVDLQKTDFLVLNGDIVSYATSIDTVIKHSVKPVASLSSRMPMVFVRGNHEGRGHDSHRVYELYPTSTGEFYYSFRQGPAAFLVLDAGEDKPDNNCGYSGTADYDAYRARELEWLREAVKDPAFRSAPVKICLIHVPTFNDRDSWYSQKWITRHFLPVLQEAGIDLMLSGHHHRHICREAEGDLPYPILVNSNMERMDVLVTATGIDIHTFDPEGREVHAWRKEVGK